MSGNGGAAPAAVRDGLIVLVAVTIGVIALLAAAAVGVARTNPDAAGGGLDLAVVGSTQAAGPKGGTRTITIELQVRNGTLDAFHGRLLVPDAATASTSTPVDLAAGASRRLTVSATVRCAAWAAVVLDGSEGEQRTVAVEARCPAPPTSSPKATPGPKATRAPGATTAPKATGGGTP